jgi:hypothetical protein
MPKINIKKLRKLAEKATPGPWFRSIGRVDDFDIMTYAIRPNGEREDLEQYEDAFAQTFTTNDDGEANGAYIAAIDPSTLLQLLDELEKLRKQIKELKDA